MDTNIQNISGGVGEAYPGSTGGEIFNYYGDDNDKNVASGDYSTTIGKKNTTTGIYSFTGGYNNNNNAENSFVFGQRNATRKVNINGYCMVVGRGNNLNDTLAREVIVLGENNYVTRSRQIRIIGDNNEATNDRYAYGVLIGNYNYSTPTLSAPVFTVACGSSGARKNAMEIDRTECKIFNNLQLANDSTAVNAITPYADPNNPTTEDQTLMTVSYFKNLLNSMNLQRRQVLVTGQITYFEKGTAYNLESTFNITIPSWANRLRMGVQVSALGATQGYVEFGLVSGNYTYTALNTGTNNFLVIAFSYNSTNKSITVTETMILKTADGSFKPSVNTLGVISITAYGKAIF